MKDIETIYKEGGLPNKGESIEAEGGELIIKNEFGDFAIIPKNKASEVERMLTEGCFGCIDELVSGLPVMEDFAEDGTLIPREDPVEPVDEAKEQEDWLVNWYQNRKMQDPASQKYLELDRDNMIAAVKDTPVEKVDEVNGNPHVLGTTMSDEGKSKIQIRKDLPKGDTTVLHEKEHAATNSRKNNPLERDQLIVDKNTRTIFEAEPKDLQPKYDGGTIFSYLAGQQEIKARLAVMRKKAGFKPDQVVEEKDIEDYLQKSAENEELWDSQVGDLLNITRDNTQLKNLLNELTTFEKDSKNKNIS